MKFDHYRRTPKLVVLNRLRRGGYPEFGKRRGEKAVVLLG